MKHFAMQLFNTALLTLAFSAATFTAGTLTAPNAFARSIDRTPVVATVSGWEYDISDIALLQDGRLQIKTGTLQAADGSYVHQVQLSRAVTESLIESAMALANIEIVETTSQIACMAMPKPSLKTLAVATYDWQKQTFDSTLRVVLTPDDCWLADKVSPKDEDNLSLAKEFRGKLVKLARKALKPHESWFHRQIRKIPYVPNSDRLII